MHDSAMVNARRFFSTYTKHKESGTVIDIGSQDVNGSLRSVVPSRFKYIGLDFQPAPNVDVVLENPYHLPFEDKMVDIVVSSSCLEHSEFFWLTWLEMVRVVKPDGLIYINVPSEGQHHPYPVDCWRFRLDAAISLMNWANRNGYPTRLLEAYTDQAWPWKDFVAIYVGDEANVGLYLDRIDL